ncbi:MAG: NusG domain II-containing protein [Oscillospiraceae bacterium]|nr:NusG domain II-containing protein [Oscillospiraceae bacterium]
MLDSKKLSFRKGDWIAVALVLILTVGVGLCFLSSGQETENAVVQIYQDGELLRELPLDGEATLTVGGKYENTLVVRDGTVAISHSTCPGEDCVHSGPIRKPGRSLVCLPNGVEVRITGTGDIDFVVG